MGRWARLVGWGFRWARRRSEGLSVSVSVSSTRSSGASVSGGEQLTVSEERREEERRARRSQGITKEGHQCRRCCLLSMRLLSGHGIMACSAHITLVRVRSQVGVSGWQKRKTGGALCTFPIESAGGEPLSFGGRV